MLEIILILVVFTIGFVGFRYAKYARDARQCSKDRENNKRDYVMANLETFGVNDIESFADPTIYVVPPEQIGLK